jgi:hypothetical protein
MECVLVVISYTRLVGPQGKRKLANELWKDLMSEIVYMIHSASQLLKLIDTIY